MARKYNYIYSHLVEKENDMIGNIAYSLYKADKIKYIENFKKKNEGIEPEEDDLCGFHEFSSSDSSIGRYKMQAMIVLNSFLDDTLSSVIKQMEADFVSQHESIMKKAMSDMVLDIKPRKFSYGVWKSIVGAFLFMIIMCAIVFIVSFKDKSFSINLGGDGSTKPTVVESPKRNSLHAQ